MPTGIRVSGFAGFQGALAAAAAVLARSDVWWVATATSYAVPIEFGRGDRGEPFFLIGLLRIAQTRGAVTVLEGSDLLGALSGEDESSLAGMIARAAERAIKDVILEKGLVETTALLDSIVAAPTLEQALAQSASLAAAANPEAVA